MLDSAQLGVLDALERRKLLVCVGPLISMAAGLAGPRELVERCREALSSAGQEAEGVTADDGIAQALERAESLLGSAAFVRLVRAAWEPLVPVPDAARALVALSPGLNSIVTTNLDRVLERAFAGRWHAVDEAAPDVAKRTRVIFKVRGTIDRPTGWMLTMRQRQNASFFGILLRRELEALLRGHVLLFVGFTPDDEDLQHLLEVREHPIADPGRRSTETMHPDLMLVPAAAWTGGARDWFGRRGIELVPLADDYAAQVTTYLHALAGELERRTHRSAPMRAADVESAEPDTVNPYPGLESFREANRRYFFGREDDLARVVGRLGDAAIPMRQWLLLDGPSGSGKSSFVQAGLVPALRDGGINLPGTNHRWRVVVMRPSTAPVFELAEQTHRVLVRDPAATFSASSLGARLRHATAAFGEFLAVHLADDEGLLLVVDQLEEAILVPIADEREVFAAVLADLLVRSPRPLLLVTALRGDFSGDLPRLPALHERVTSTHPPVRYTLGNLSTAQLESAIDGPAREARVELEPGLTERVLVDAGIVEQGDGDGNGTPEAVLPLVATVMTSLYDRRDGRTLTHAAYDALGGVAGALTRRADESLAPLLRDFSDEQLWNLFRKLVETESQGRATRRTLRRADALAAVGGGPRAEALLARLAGSERSMRLVVVHGDGSKARVDLVHEALLRGWPWLRDHIDRDRAELIRESELDQAAERWQRRGRPTDSLPGGAEAGYFLNAATAVGTLTRDYQDALRANLRRRRNKLSAAFTALTLGIFTLAGLSIFAFNQRDSAQQAAARESEAAARESEAAARESEAAARATRAADETRDQAARARDAIIMAGTRELLANSDPLAGRLIVEVAAPGVIDGWLALAYDVLALGAPRHVLHSQAKLGVVAVSPDAGTIIAGLENGSVLVWDLDTHRMDTRTGHSMEIWSAEFSADGERFVTASADKTARVWELATGRSISLEGHRDVVRSARFSADGKQVVTASSDKTVRVWELATGRFVELKKHTNQVYTAGFSPEGEEVITVSADDTARSWEPDTGDSYVLINKQDEPLWASFSADGKHIVGHGRTWLWVWGPDQTRSINLTGQPYQALDATFSANGSLAIITEFGLSAARVVNMDTREVVELRDPAGGAALSGDLNSDGTRAITVSVDGNLRLWATDPPHLSASTFVELGGDQPGLRHAQFSANGDYVVTTSEHAIRVFELDAAPVIELRDRSHPVSSAGFSADGTRVVTTSSDGTARVWELSTRQFIELKGHTGAVLSAAFSVDGKRVVSASKDGTVRVWDLNTHESVVLDGLKNGDVSPVFSNDRKLVRTHNKYSGVLRVWDLETHQLKESDMNIKSAGLRGDGALIVTTRSELSVWEPPWELPVARHEFPEFSESVTSATLSPDGQRIVIANGHRACVWEPTSGTIISLEGHSDTVNSAEFSTDGKRVVTTSNDKTARVWEFETGHFTELKGHWSIVESAEFSSDGAHVITAGVGMAQVWESKTGQQIELKGLFRSIESAKFSADGKQVVTVSDDRAARVWSLEPMVLHRHLANASTECLPPDLRVRYLVESPVEARAAHEACLPKP